LTVQSWYSGWSLEAPGELYERIQRSRGTTPLHKLSTPSGHRFDSARLDISLQLDLYFRTLPY
jgi:hypothetical protein